MLAWTSRSIRPQSSASDGRQSVCHQEEKVGFPHFAFRSQNDSKRQRFGWTEMKIPWELWPYRWHFHGNEDTFVPRGAFHCWPQWNFILMRSGFGQSTLLTYSHSCSAHPSSPINQSNVDYTHLQPRDSLSDIEPSFTSRMRSSFSIIHHSHHHTLFPLAEEYGQ